MARARRFVAECGFAVAAVDVPGHGDRPTDEEYDRIATENQARVDAGEELAPLIAGFQALVARQTVPEWRAVLDAVQELDHVGAGPVGYWGVSLGCGLGVPFVAAEPRVRAAVLGLGGALASAEAAARITVPVEFLVQWDDERVPRAQSLALFDALGLSREDAARQPRQARGGPGLRAGQHAAVLRPPPRLRPPPDETGSRPPAGPCLRRAARRRVQDQPAHWSAVSTPSRQAISQLGNAQAWVGTVRLPGGTG